MNKKITYLIFGVLLLILRLIFNFKFELIPGINGGYYPLQVRTLIETGHLGFSDMPLYFYINALFVKFISLFISINPDQLIIYTSKIIDSISLPFLAVPLYLIDKNIFENKIPKYFEIFIVGFATLSFSPLILTSDLQKNAFAIPLMLFFVYYLFLFFKNKSNKYLIISVFFIILIGLTHLGVFSISILILLTSLIVFYRKKALLPIIGVLVIGFLLVYLFDTGRTDRLINFWFVIFEKPTILQGPLSPPDLLNYLLSYLLIALGITYIVKYKKDRNEFKAKTLIIFLITIFILSFPLLDIEYAKRFSLLLFIPQIIVLFILFKYFNQKLRIMISSVLILMTGGSIFIMTNNVKPPSITQKAFQDLKNLKQFVLNPTETLIIARHGLEWWTAWQLKTKIGQDKSVDKNTFFKYKKVIILVQLKGVNQMYLEEKSPFHEPYFPTERKPFYNSIFFRATELKKQDMKNIEPLQI